MDTFLTVGKENEVDYGFGFIGTENGVKRIKDIYVGGENGVPVKMNRHSELANKVGAMSGNPIFTDKADDDSVVHVEMDGKSVQDGEPTPDYPIEIHSVNDVGIVSSKELMEAEDLESIQSDELGVGVYKTNLLLDEPLRSVGDVKDRLFRDEDGLFKIERCIGEYIITGNESWPMAGSPTNRFNSNNILPSRSLENGYSINSHYALSWANHFNSLWIDGASLRIRDTQFNSPTDLTNFLKSEHDKGSPLVVQYQLETLKTETLSDELQVKLNNIASFKDSNYVYTIDEHDLQPTLHATFKTKYWHESMVKIREWELVE